MRASLIAAALLCIAGAAFAAESVVLTDDNWYRYAPEGKEVDCIIGDFVLRNDRIVAVVAQPAAGRNANMTVRNVGGSLIDLTLVGEPNDQLSCYYPCRRRYAFSRGRVVSRNGDRAAVHIWSKAKKNGEPDVRLEYEVADGQPYLIVRTIFANPWKEPITVPLEDDLRMDRVPDRSRKGFTSLYWVHDRHFEQAYGVVVRGHRMSTTSTFSQSLLRFYPGKSESPSVRLAPGAEHIVERWIIPGRHLLAVQGKAAAVLGEKSTPWTFVVAEKDGRPVVRADIIVYRDDKELGRGKTGYRGRVSTSLAPGKYKVVCKAVGRPNLEKGIAVANEPGETRFVMAPASMVAARITDAKGNPIPCKVAFKGVEGTPNPNWGPPAARRFVINLAYAVHGKFRVPINPGKYVATITYGPEHDMVQVPLTVEPEKTARLEAKLKRAYETPGWVSTDFHSHSSPSGDNTADQRGRVINLICEQIDFAPCTEHNRVDSYRPHLVALGALHLLGTCPGIELTGSPLPLNHQNAFPMEYHPRTQDGGAPLTDADPTVQIRRLAGWGSLKQNRLVQQNHPDIGWLFFDKNGDGKPDDGFKAGFPYMHVIEVHPIHDILQMSPGRSFVSGGKRRIRNNTIFNWLQMLNQGYRIPGVVNTDAHYNYHGSGGLRNYVRCDAKVNGEIDPYEIVEHAKKGHIVMSNGPFLDVNLNGKLPGDDVALAKGTARLKMRVCCPNWFDINRVQVLLNGRPAKGLNFTRKTHPNLFSNAAVRFAHEVTLNLKEDTHIIVVAVDERKPYGEVMGPMWGRQHPVAVSNPIFVDVDGGGFRFNRDTLGHPLPTKSGS